MYESISNKWKTACGSSSGVLALGLVLALLLALLPAGWSASIKNVAREVLRPGQIAASVARRHGDHVKTLITSHWHTVDQLAEVRRELGRLKLENSRLTSDLAASTTKETASADISEDDRLLRARCVRANVLGRQARAFLGRHHLLDVGTADGVEPKALVIDRGDDAELKPNQLVLSGRNVWGQLVELGTNTSTVRPVTDHGYRDLVRVGTGQGPQGIVEGTGEPLARIRLIEVTEPLAVGDTVFATGAKGLLRESLVYGQIERLERKVGAAHWDIWMRPAIADEPDTVSVLSVELNPSRVASRAR